MRPGGLRDDSSPDLSQELALPETAQVAAVRELGALLESDDRFAALHDVMDMFRTTTAEGYDLRVFETWSPRPDDEMAMGMVVSLSNGKQLLGAWDMGIHVEAIEGVVSTGPGRFEIVIVPRFDEESLDDVEPETNRISVAYTVEAGEASPLRVRFGRRSRIVPRSTRRRDRFMSRVRRIHVVEVEREDLVHARIFECENVEDTNVTVLLQISDGAGKVKTFDLGMRVASIAHVAARDDREIVVQGRLVVSSRPSSARMTAVIRALGTKAVPDRIAIAKSE